MVERIRLLLEARQFTPTQFADAIGVARPIVSHILSGRNKPSLEVVQRILAAMPDLSITWLLNGTGPMQAAPAAPQPTTLQSPQTVQLARNELISASVPEQADRASIPATAPKGQKIAATPGAGAGPALSVPSFQPLPGRFKPQKLESASITVPSPGSSEPSSLPLAAPAPGQAPETAAPAGSPAALESRPTGPTATALFSGSEKPIRRIVIFYRDGSFADYQPE